MSNVMVPRTPSMAEHAANIGWIVRCLALHQPGDWGDCAINDAVVSIIDERRPAYLALTGAKKKSCLLRRAAYWRDRRPPGDYRRITRPHQITSFEES